jgi:hypothetical protein
MRRPRTSAADAEQNHQPVTDFTRHASFDCHPRVLTLDYGCIDLLIWRRALPLEMDVRPERVKEAQALDNLSPKADPWAWPLRPATIARRMTAPQR